ncbi:hypothetical protein Pcinc_042377 [Petrolisthes cinctipes]|uniref:Uncharacterized protein n=1 Tax=Petrolisthes cinctipes TaxID=88211 RepID=A0AAE1BKS4_PETCI|nr:hypothetical protein Pcinc_042377 [Petrolisthes cinctipes]
MSRVSHVLNGHFVHICPHITHDRGPPGYSVTAAALLPSCPLACPPCLPAFLPACLLACLERSGGPGRGRIASRAHLTNPLCFHCLPSSCIGKSLICVHY